MKVVIVMKQLSTTRYTCRGQGPTKCEVAPVGMNIIRNSKLAFGYWML